MALSQTEAEKDVVNLWRAWRTAKEMCSDRGYELSQEELAISLDEFRGQHCDANGLVNRNNLTFTAKPTVGLLAKFTDPPTNKNPNPEPAIGTIIVQFNGDQNVGVKTLRTFAHDIKEGNYFTGIFVSLVPVTATALKIIPTLLPNILEVFNEQDLLVNITRHELVPKHVLLSKEEKEALLARYRVKENQLPRIQTTDPVARYLGLRRGHVVKIIRRSETAGRYASYRWTI